MFKLEFIPKAVCWVHASGKARSLVAVSDSESPVINIYDGRQEDGAEPVMSTCTLHSNPVTLIKYNDHFDCAVSVDQKGIVEYWQPNPSFSLPQHSIKWQYKTDTDLYEFVKNKSTPTSLEFSPDGQMFVTQSMDDRQVRVFNFLTGKLHRKYDESLQTISEMQQAGTAAHRLDDMEFGRRLAVERELQSSPAAEYANAVFDDSGNFILYACLSGIKIVNLTDNKVSQLIGKGETGRFLNISLYQGAPKKKFAMTLASCAITLYYLCYYLYITGNGCIR